MLCRIFKPLQTLSLVLATENNPTSFVFIFTI